MKYWQRGTRIALLVTLALGAVAALSPSVMSAIVHPEGPAGPPRSNVQFPDGGLEEWVMTPEAEARTLRGDCPQNYECLELCVSGVPMDEFQCWPEGWR